METEKNNQPKDSNDARDQYITDPNNTDKQNLSLEKNSEFEKLDYTPETFFTKLTEKQQKTIQIIAGLISGFLVWFSMGLGLKFFDNAIMRWLFIFIFAAIMLTKSHIERTSGIYLKTFSKFFLISLIFFMGVFILYGAVTGQLSGQIINPQ